MTQLFVARHGEALPPNVDPTQPLSTNGIKECEAIACLLKGRLEIDEIVHSTKLRAKQTAEILGNTLAPDLSLIQREGLNPSDSIEPILTEIQHLDWNLLIVGHLPFLEKLLTTLLLTEEKPSPILLNCSTVICLKKESSNWLISWAINPQFALQNSVR